MTEQPDLFLGGSEPEPETDAEAGAQIDPATGRLSTIPEAALETSPAMQLPSSTLAHPPLQSPRFAFSGPSAFSGAQPGVGSNDVGRRTVSPAPMPVISGPDPVPFQPMGAPLGSSVEPPNATGIDFGTIYGRRSRAASPVDIPINVVAPSPAQPFISSITPPTPQPQNSYQPVDHGFAEPAQPMGAFPPQFPPSFDSSNQFPPAPMDDGVVYGMPQPIVPSPRGPSPMLQQDFGASDLPGELGQVSEQPPRRRKHRHRHRNGSNGSVNISIIPAVRSFLQIIH